jgi:hypothetical protein
LVQEVAGYVVSNLVHTVDDHARTANARITHLRDGAAHSRFK